MSPTPKRKEAQPLKILTEEEIQRRLYGRYLKLPQRSEPPASITEAMPGSPPASDAEWTGAEILSEELKSLREELLRLRQERERLMEELSHRLLPHREPFQESHLLPMGETKVGFWKTVGSLLGAALLLLAIGYSIGERLLQASPSVHLEPTPYTVQVAVYHARSVAERTAEQLHALGYPAFLVEWPRGKAKFQYRVYVGRFVTREEASLERERLVSDPRFSDAFVRLR